MACLNMYKNLDEFTQGHSISQMYEWPSFVIGIIICKTVKELKHDIDYGLNRLHELELELTTGVTGR